MYEKLLKIQQELKVPKNRKNTFGNYNYRSCEDIVEAVKPLCVKNAVTLTLTDEVIEVGGRVFVKATAQLRDKMIDEGGKNIQVSGWAEIAPEKKGMDVAQITGAASSYARKYALNGLFAIDDVQDADATNHHGAQEEVDYVHKLKVCTTRDNLKKVWEELPASVKVDPEVLAMKEEKKKELTK